MKLLCVLVVGVFLVEADPNKKGAFEQILEVNRGKGKY